MDNQNRITQACGFSWDVQVCFVVGATVPSMRPQR